MADSKKGNASRLLTLNGLDLVTRSVATVNGEEVGLTRTPAGPRLVVLGDPCSPLLSSISGDRNRYRDLVLIVGPLDGDNLDTLRASLPWLSPRVLGTGATAGFGDRLGMATPGHVRALRAAGGDVAPVFAQQSIREMDRTARSPRQVLDDAAWGVLAEGWREGFGADADHLKTFEHIDTCVEAGYTFFTFDPGEHVDDRAESADASTLRTLLDGLPWSTLEDTLEDLKGRYKETNLDLEVQELPLDEDTIARAAVKYGRAVAHVADMYRHLQDAAGNREFEVEVSVDETDLPTTHVQHLYIATELRRLGVRWVSLAPRYLGRFEKGVDYIGDAGEFERDFAIHATIARDLGPYKLSLHSGSDKFSIYAAAARQTRGMVHLKTAGTSYLEALRAVADLDPAFFRDVYSFAHSRYEQDRASYHVSAELERAPLPQEVPDSELPRLLEDFDTREILHVTFGSVLQDYRLRDRLLELLRHSSEEYANYLTTHFMRHLEPFANVTEEGP